MGNPRLRKRRASILGFANFYRRIISRFSQRTRSLTELTKGEQITTKSGKKRTKYMSGHRRNLVINPSSVISKRSHVASFAAKVSAIYSASVDDNVTVVCLLEHQLIGLLFSMNTELQLDFRCYLSKVMSLFLVPLRYLRMCLAASIWILPGFFACRLITDFAKAMSGLVSIIAKVMDPTMV